MDGSDLSIRLGHVEGIEFIHDAAGLTETYPLDPISGTDIDVVLKRAAIVADDNPLDSGVSYFRFSDGLYMLFIQERNVLLIEGSDGSLSTVESALLRLLKERD